MLRSISVTTRRERTASGHDPTNLISFAASASAIYMVRDAA
jgi:hypothetical protein